MNVNREEMEQLVKNLISYASVVNTEGERKMAEILYHYIANWPYFQQRPEQVLLTRTYHDQRERYNVIAYVKGSAVQSPETVILMAVASHLYILKHFAQHPEELQGNVLVVLTCDEEDSSHGIRSALKDLRRLQEREGFEFIAAINADYTSARYPGDENRYIYVRTVGKLLPTLHTGNAPFNGPLKHTWSGMKCTAN